MTRVERELHTLATAPPVAPAPIDAIRQRARVLRRRRRAATSLAVTALIIAVVAVPIVALQGSKEDPLVIADGGAGGRPTEIVAVTSALDLVAVSLGGEQRLIAKLDRFDDFERALDVAPDGSFVYVAEGVGDPVTCDSRIVRFPLEGRSEGAEEIVDRGDTPAVSPDGRRLAYIERSERTDGDPGCVDTLVVRDLATGSEQRWTDPSEPAHTPQGTAVPIRLHGLVWSPDGQTLGFTRSTATFDFAFVFNTATNASELRGTQLRRPDDTVGWIVVGWLPSGEVVVRSTCKGQGSLDQCAGHDSAVLATDASTGAVMALSDIPDNTSSVWLAPGGDQLIYIVGDGLHGARGVLYRRFLGGEPIEVARDIVAATWKGSAGPSTPPDSLPKPSASDSASPDAVTTTTTSTSATRVTPTDPSTSTGTCTATYKLAGSVAEVRVVNLHGAGGITVTARFADGNSSAAIAQLVPGIDEVTLNVSVTAPPSEVSATLSTDPPITCTATAVP